MKPYLVALLLLPASVSGQKVIGGCPIFPATNFWNTRVDNLPVHPMSAKWVEHVGVKNGLRYDPGICTTLVSGKTVKWVNVVPASPPPQSDFGRAPIPPNACSEPGDEHVLAIDTDTCIVYEMYGAKKKPDNSWAAESTAMWDLNSNAQRTGDSDLTSADAAGLSITAGLLMYDEALNGTINHAIRFTTPVTLYGSYLWPATHYASRSKDTTMPPMGARFRLRANFDVSKFSTINQHILQAIKTYGIILADNGQAWGMQFHADPRWNDPDLVNLRSVLGSNMEAVDTSSMMVDVNSAYAATPTLAVASVTKDKLGRTSHDPLTVNGTGRPLFDLPPIKTITQNYTVEAADNRSTIRYAGAGPVTVTVPEVPAGFGLNITQEGTGQVTVLGSKAAVHHAPGANHTTGQWTAMSLHCTAANSCLLLNGVR